MLCWCSNQERSSTTRNEHCGSSSNNRFVSSGKIIRHFLRYFQLVCSEEKNHSWKAKTALNKKHNLKGERSAIPLFCVCLSRYKVATHYTPFKWYTFYSQRVYWFLCLTSPSLQCCLWLRTAPEHIDMYKHTCTHTYTRVFLWSWKKHLFGNFFQILIFLFLGMLNCLEEVRRSSVR